MSWESPSSFRRTITTSTSNYLFFITKFQEFRNLNQSKIIALTITKTNAKNLWFCMQSMALIIDQTKGNIKGNVR